MAENVPIIAGETEAYSEPPAAAQPQAPEADHSRYVQLRDKLQAEVDGKANAISGAQDLDVGAKHRALTDLWNQAVEAESNLSQLYAKELQEKIDRAERRVFHVPARLADSVRSAYQMASGEVEFASFTADEGFEGLASSREKLTEIYDRAARTGDKALQLAVYHLATERGIHSLRDRHLSTSSELSKAWTDYTAARKKLDHWNNSEERMWGQLSGTRGLRKPPELR